MAEAELKVRVDTDDAEQNLKKFQKQAQSSSEAPWVIRSPPPNDGP